MVFDKWKTILLFKLLLLAWVPLSAASDQARSIYTTDESLLSTEHSNGSSSHGLFVDFFQQVAKDADFPNAEVKRLPWKRAQISAERGDTGVIGPITRTPKRENKYKWIGKLFPMRIAYINLSGDNPIHDLATARQKVIAVKAGSSGEFAAKKHGLLAEKTVVVATQENILRMLEKGYVDGWLVWDIIAHRAVLEHGKTQKLTLQEGYVDVLGDLYLAASPKISDAELLVWREALQKNIQSGELKRLLSRYLETDYIN